MKHALTGCRRERLSLIRPLILSCLAALLVLGCSAVSVEPQKGSNGINAPDQVDKPYLILISIDGFRWDYPELFSAPAIKRLASRGIRAERLMPVFPTLTFPNHYSIATGMYPGNHGIVANEFRDGERDEWYIYKESASAQDGSWYGGEPVWVSAEKAGMVTAAYFFVGSEADIQGVRPSHWYPFNKGISGRARVSQILEWLKEEPETRPHLYTLYFEDVDDHGHWYGPDSDENRAAVKKVDSYISYLLDGLEKLPYGDQVNIVLVSDHGQAAYNLDSKPLILNEVIDISGISVVDGGPYVFMYFEPGQAERIIEARDRINSVWQCGRAWLPEDAPASWQLNGNSRFADLLVVAEPGCAVLSTEDMHHKMTAGDHGWPPDMPEMSGIFIAAGPTIPHGLEIGPLNSVDIYPLLMSLLGLEASGEVDSNPGILLPLLLQPTKY